MNSFPFRLREKIIRAQKDCFHRRVIGDDSENDIGKPAHLRDFLDRLGAQFLGQLRRIAALAS